MIPEKAQGKVNEAKVLAVGPGARGKVGERRMGRVVGSGKGVWRKGEGMRGRELEVSTHRTCTHHTTQA